METGRLKRHFVVRKLHEFLDYLLLSSQENSPQASAIISDVYYCVFLLSKLFNRLTEATFEVIATTPRKDAVIWVVIPPTPLVTCRRFGAICFSIFKVKERASGFLRNVSKFSLDYMAPQFEKENYLKSIRYFGLKFTVTGGHFNVEVSIYKNYHKKLSLLLHRAFRRITLIINQQMHLHKISH